MSEPIVPKGQQTAYQRWELTSLAGSGAPARGPRAQNPPLPTAADIERVHQAAYAEGLAEGRESAAAIAAALGALLTSVKVEISAWEEQIAEDIVSLAVDIAHQVVRETPVVRRDAIVPVVREAIQEMPLFSAGARLVLHPSDAELVRQQLGDQLNQLGWRVVEDGLIERGGCRIASTTTHVDATNATRWERVVAALGRNRPWLERGPARRATDPTKAAA
jgi:flagellar assembly protein FliH